MTTFTAKELSDMIGVCGTSIINVARRHNVSFKQRSPKKAIRFCKTSALRLFSMYKARPDGCKKFIKRARKSVTKTVTAPAKSKQVTVKLGQDIKTLHITIDLVK